MLSHRIDLTHFAEMIVRKIHEVVRSRDASKSERICRLSLRLETIASLEDLEEIEQSQVI